MIDVRLVRSDPDGVRAALARRNDPDRKLAIEYVSIEQLKPAARQMRKHADKQLAAIRGSIRRFGVNAPILVDDELTSTFDMAAVGQPMTRHLESRLTRIRR